jgi:hypothetical protein
MLDNISVFLPVGKEKVQQLLDELSKSMLPDYPSIILYGLAEIIEEFRSNGISVESDRNSWDYVYSTSDLADLPGDKYHSKRNLIKRCLSKYRCEYRPIDSEVIRDCLQLQTEWCNLRRCDDTAGLDAENRAIKALFEAYERLNVTGGAVYVDGKLEAFTMAESLNNETAVIHFEKANPEIIGLYQVINAWFCQNALRNFAFVNREQDLGVPGLRKAKMSYHPHHMVEKYLATLVPPRDLGNVRSWQCEFFGQIPLGCEL